jgi:hypothetical protein
MYRSATHDYQQEYTDGPWISSPSRPTHGQSTYNTEGSTHPSTGINSNSTTSITTTEQTIERDINNGK